MKNNDTYLSLLWYHSYDYMSSSFNIYRLTLTRIKWYH